jgi:hypothetical protein
MIEQSRHEAERLRRQLEHPGRAVARIRHSFQSSPDMRLWSLLVGTTLVWLLFFTTGYGLASLNCRWGWFPPGGASGVKSLQILGAVLAAALVIGSGSVAWYDWQRPRQAGNGEMGEEMAERVSMLAFVILMLNALYLLIILATLAPILTLPACS